MKIRILPIAVLALGLLPGCANRYVVRDLLCDQRSIATAASRAAGCMTAAAIEIAQRKKEESREQPSAGRDTEEAPEADPRYKDWIP